MDFQLEPYTEAGERFVALAEQHAIGAAALAPVRDDDDHRAASAELIESMQQSGFLLATVRADLGGLGLESLRDFAVGIGRLARGSGATAIVASMTQDGHELLTTTSPVGPAGLVGAALGMAERAHELALDAVLARDGAAAGREGVRRRIAESEIDLATCRSVLGHTGRLLDRTVIGSTTPRPGIDLRLVDAQWHGATYEIVRRATDVVDRSSKLIRGSGMPRPGGDVDDELDRLDRDLRSATGFVTDEPGIVFERIGRAVLGLDAVT
jgi:alkylation response protein AidB-like acyl-CoA dehydrogenase